MAIHEGDILLRRDSKKRYRLVHKLSTRDAPNRPPTHVVVIELNSNKAAPILWSLAQTQSELADGELLRVVEAPLAVDLSAASKPELEALERRWDLIKRIKECGPKIFDRAFRGQFAADLAKNKIASKPFFYSTFRQYLQVGSGGKQTLSTGRFNCGAPDRERVPHEGSRKTGRPRHEGKGLVLTEIHRKRMYIAFSKAPVGLKGRNLRSAYYWMLVKYYFNEIRILPVAVPDDSEAEAANQETEPVTPRCEIVVADAVPTFATFRYHYNKRVTRRERELKRLGFRRFELANKPQLTGTLTEVDGVGKRYYIDATVLDVYAVSRFNKKRIVGRPTLYLVVDQFSRLIVGMYIGLEPPCWVGALLALYNCSVDKVEFCEAYGVTITPEEWPTGGIPQHLMGDRGEHIAEANDRLVDGFGLEIDTARPYAGEAKGVGERAFGVLQASYGPFVPGYVDKNFIGRDAEPPALRAALDIIEITRVMIDGILDANRRVIAGYEASPEQIIAGVPSQPLALWHWCVSEYRYCHQSWDLNYLKRYLWPRTPLRTARKMLRFCTGLFFQGEPVGQQDWFFEALRSKATFEARYNPLHLDSILVLPGGRQSAFTVEPTARCARLAVFSHSELMSLRRQSAMNDAAANWSALPARAAFQADALEIVSQAMKEHRRQAAEAAPSSKSARLKGIKANRAEELAALTAQALGLSGMSLAGPEMSTAQIADGTDADVRALLHMRKSPPDAA